MDRIKDKIKNIVESDSFKLYKEEQSRILKDWQYCESASLNEEARFTLDKEAYVEVFYKSVYTSRGEYKESNLLELLIKNLKDVEHPVWIDYRSYLINRLNTLKLPQQKKKITKVSKNKEEEVWFKVGVLFANGTMDKYYTLNKDNELVMSLEYSAPKIAEELQHPEYEKQILHIINNYGTVKDIFSRSTKMKQIIQYCDKHKIPITSFFTNKYNLIKAK